MKELKESHPLEVTEFAVAHGVDQMPAFKWWVAYMLKKRDDIIASVRKRIAQTTHKYGIEFLQVGIMLRRLIQRMVISYGEIL